jgi:hypothetical protein
MNGLRACLLLTPLLAGFPSDSLSQVDDLKSCPNLMRTFFEEPTTVRYAEFLSYSLDAQFQIYICGTQYRHPPDFVLAQPFASQGQAAAQYLRPKLQSATRDRTIRDILLVFFYMVIDRRHDVRDTEIMRLIDAKVSAVQDRYAREAAEDMLTLMRAAPAFPASSPVKK